MKFKSVVSNISAKWTSCAPYCFGISMFFIILVHDTQAQTSDPVQTARELIEQQRYSDALSIYENLYNSNPDNYDYRLMIGLLLGWNGDFGKSEKHFKSMYADFPMNVEIGTALMRVLSWQHKYSESFSYSEELIKLYPENIDLLTIIAQTYYWSGGITESAVYVEKALKIDPENEVMIRLQREIKASRRAWIEGGIVFSSDSDQTDLTILSAKIQLPAISATRIQIGVNHFETTNNVANISRDARYFYVTLFRELNRSWILRADLGLSDYSQDIVGKPRNLVSGGLDLRFNSGRHTLNLTGGSNTILESPYLIDNRLQIHSAIITYRFRTGNWTFITDPQFAVLSDKNTRISFSAVLLYSYDLDFGSLRPAIRLRNQQFENVVTDMGYFSPESMSSASLQLEYDTHRQGDDFSFRVSAETGFQKTTHPAVDNDPKFVYQFGVAADTKIVNDLYASAIFQYSNLQNISALINDNDYWYRSIQLRLRYVF